MTLPYGVTAYGVADVAPFGSSAGDPVTPIAAVAPGGATENAIGPAAAGVQVVAGRSIVAS